MASIYFICPASHIYSSPIRAADFIFPGHLWDRLPVETVWLSSVFRLIGGGPNLAIALCLTMASDFSTEETRYVRWSYTTDSLALAHDFDRSKSFYRVFAASLFTDMISPSIAFATLRHSLWLPYLICALSLLCTYPVLLYMPEPLSKPSRNIEPNTAERTGLTAYFKFLKDWRILVGVVTVFLAQFRQNTLEILLPYASVRFHLELSKVRSIPSAFICPMLRTS
jgi:hypothetical protein